MIRALSPLRRCGQVPLKFDKVATALVFRAQYFRKDVYKVVAGSISTKPLVLSMITGSYFRRRRRLTICEPDETIFASHLTFHSV